MVKIAMAAFRRLFLQNYSWSFHGLLNSMCLNS